MLGSFRNQAICYAEGEKRNRLHERERLEFLRDNMMGMVAASDSEGQAQTQAQAMPRRPSPSMTFTVSPNATTTTKAKAKGKSKSRMRTVPVSVSSDAAVVDGGRDMALEDAMVEAMGGGSPLILAPAPETLRDSDSYPTSTITASKSEFSASASPDPIFSASPSAQAGGGCSGSARPLTPKSGRWWVGDFHPNSARSLPLPEREREHDQEDAEVAYRSSATPRGATIARRRKKENTDDVAVGMSWVPVGIASGVGSQGSRANANASPREQDQRRRQGGPAGRGRGRLSASMPFSEERVPSDLDEGYAALVDRFDLTIAEMKAEEQAKAEIMQEKEKKRTEAIVSMSMEAGSGIGAGTLSARSGHSQSVFASTTGGSVPRTRGKKGTGRGKGRDTGLRLKDADREALFQESKFFCSGIPSREDVIARADANATTRTRRPWYTSRSVHSLGVGPGSVTGHGHVPRVETGRVDPLVESCEAFLDRLVERERGLVAVKATRELDRIRSPMPKWYEMRGKSFNEELARSAQPRRPKYEEYLTSLSQL